MMLDGMMNKLFTSKKFVDIVDSLPLKGPTLVWQQASPKEVIKYAFSLEVIALSF
jgi:hypothetical protein